MKEEKKQIFLWYGENDYEIFQQLSSWTEIFEKKYSGLNITTFDFAMPGTKEQLNKSLKNALQVNSLFGSNKLIVLKNFLTPKLDKEWQGLIIETLKKLTDGFFVVFVQKDKPDARGKLYKEVMKLSKKDLAEVKEYQLPKGNELVKWILKKSKKESTTFEDEAISVLVASVGSDLWQLDLEIKKLANYKKEEVINAGDVNLLVKGKYNDDIFQLMDVLSEKNRKKAMKLFKDQLDSGANEIYLLTMLTRQFRIFWQVKELTKDNDLRPDEVARELRIHPFVAKKTLHYLRNFKLQELKDIYTKLLDFEIQMKTTKVNFELLFGLLVAKLK